jgi:multiple sugar transport system permease protein
VTTRAPARTRESGPPEAPPGPTPPGRGPFGAWRRRLSDTFEREQPFGALLIGPGVVVLILTTTLPLAYLVGTSFFRYDLTAPEANGFVGLANYIAITQDARFWHSLRLSVIYTVSTVTLQVITGMALALLVERVARGRAIIRVAALLPILFAPVVVGLVWRTLMLTPDFGVVDYLSQTLGLGSHNWLGDPTLALVSVIVMHTWQWTPFAFLIFLASLATIPREVLEAAQIDGANFAQRFRYIILPLLRPAIIVVVIFRTVIALSAFDAIFAATGGGPGTATEILNLYVYRVSFRFLSIGYGAALAVVLLLITFVIALAFARLRRAPA